MPARILTLIFFLRILSDSQLGFAQTTYDPPAGYYRSAIATGDTLKQQLHDIIDEHTSFSYNDMRTMLQVTDADPDNPGNLLLVYDRSSIDLSQIGGSIDGWDSGQTWNREHTWPRSHGVDRSGPDNTDMHQLRPSDPGINGSRGNLDFGGAYGSQSFGRVSDKGSTVWYPGDTDAGMIARQQFYMAVRYDGSDGSTEDLELGDGIQSGNRLGDLARLLEWHYAAAPDDFELRRNHLIYGFQNNRNPFIDQPELVWSLFQDQQNDSRISIAGGNTDADGASLREIDLGRVFVGADVPAATSVTLDKAGLDGTYYEITTIGDAISSLNGRHNPFRTGSSDSNVIEVGLSGSTATPGLLGGSIIIDNLDVTTGGGTGRGANDGNDAVNLSLTVLDHATASFDSTATVKELTYDFGTLVQGDPTEEFAFAISNLANISADFTAGLDIDQVSHGGDVTKFMTSLAVTDPANAINGNESRGFVATVDASTVGLLSATYTIQVSDEDVAGALSDTLTLNLIANVIASEPSTGDYDRDGDTDIDDYVLWQSTFNSSTQLDADGNGNGIVDAADLVIWRDAANAANADTVQSVPEPAPCLQIWIALLAAPLLLRGANRKIHGTLT